MIGDDDVRAATDGSAMSAGAAVDRAAAPRLLFIGGLHRSGTSLIHRCISAHPQVAGFHDTGSLEDEGQYLQSVYPIGQAHGGPGRFALDPRCHLTESSPLVSRSSRELLLAQWGAFWEPGASVRVEKSPPNLVRMRFLQALFPESAFLMVMRHPVAVACATQKWSHTPWTTLIHHWVAAHEIMLADSAHVSRVHVIRYEDFVRAPEETLRPVWSTLGLPSQPAGERVRSDVNRTYFERWSKTRNPVRVLDRRRAERHDEAARRFGYSVRDLAFSGRNTPRAAERRPGSCDPPE
ncbi:MAG: sulfotransferase family protein [Gaiellales bacterium]